MNARYALKDHDPDAKELLSMLLYEARCSRLFLALVFASCAIATFGLMENSAAVIIGAMIIAPMMLPIQGIAFGTLEGNAQLLRRAIGTLLIGSLLAIGISFLLGRLFGFVELGSEVRARTYPTLLDLGIALVAGGIAGFAKVRVALSSSLVGTAIAVALMPPLCVTGLELARANLDLANGSFLLFITNVLGITLACMVAYLAGGFTNFHRAAIRTLGLFVMVLLLVVPLGINLMRLVNESQLEQSVRATLESHTVTFSGAKIISFNVDWTTKPAQIHTVVRSQHRITPTQVALVEALLKRQNKQQFTLVVDVSRLDEVTSQGVDTASPNPQSR
jgi:uncharacterized hydrophobic protein (TIGR00271 family)